MGIHSLRKYTESKCIFKENDIKDLSIQLCNALCYMNKYGYIHGDLKPDNIMTFLNSNYKLIDFGFSMKWYRVFDTELPPTSWYRPLELFIESKMDTNKIDSWSLGCIIYEMITNKPLFFGKNDNEVLECIKLKMGESRIRIREDFFKYISDKCRNANEYSFIINSLEKDINIRKTVKELFNIWDIKDSKFIPELEKNNTISNNNFDQKDLVNIFQMDMYLDNFFRNNDFYPSDSIESFYLTIHYYKILLNKIEDLEISNDIISEIVLSCKILSLLIVFGTKYEINMTDLGLILSELDYKYSRINILRVHDLVCNFLNWDLDPITIYSYSHYIDKKYINYYLFIGFIISLDNTILCSEFEKAIISESISRILYNVINNDNLCRNNSQLNSIINNNINDLNMDKLLDTLSKINKTFILNFGLVKELNEREYYFDDLVQTFCNYNKWYKMYDEFKEHIIGINNNVINDIILIFN
jgi:serine/threonine protein kinase